MSIFEKRKEAEPVAEPARETADFRLPDPEPRPRAPEAAPRTVAVIGKTITIKGDVTGDENLVIDGRVEGTVRLNGNDLTIGASGRQKGNATARVVRIDGEMTGDIVGLEKVVISKTGRVRGNIVTPRITLDDGANFKGSIDMDPGAEKQTTPPAAPKPVAVAKPATGTAPIASG
jgi:cytoskeletal protein CcmA (bactofilin family)